MNKRSAAKKRAEWPRAYDSDEFVEWGQLCECCACGRKGTIWAPNENHHIKPVGEIPVGTGRKADAKWILILCKAHHTEAHWGEQTFAGKYDLDLPFEARAHWATWQLQKGELAE